MIPNARITEFLCLPANIDPAAYAAGTIATNWISVGMLQRMLFIISSGVLGTSATVDAKVQQATDSSGTGAKDITAMAITTIVKASGDNRQSLLNLPSDQLDSVNGFSYVRLFISISGPGTSIVSALALATSRSEPASALNQSAVVQIV